MYTCSFKFIDNQLAACPNVCQISYLLFCYQVSPRLEHRYQCSGSGSTSEVSSGEKKPEQIQVSGGKNELAKKYNTRWTIFKHMRASVWPKDDPGMKIRFMCAFGALLGAKVSFV